MAIDVATLEDRCSRLRALHVRGEPLLLPNAWDVATARAVEDAGFPAVATTSGGVAASLGFEDHEGGPAEEMLAAAGRIAAGVGLPVTVDAEAGYGMEPAELARALREIGVAGVNLEDGDHAAGRLRDPDVHAEWLGALRGAADELGYGLVLNARIDVFVAPGSREAAQGPLVPEALRRAEAYSAAGADCAYPIALWERDALKQFMSEFAGPVNILRIPPAPSNAELAELGVARISWGGGLQAKAAADFRSSLDALRAGA